MSAEKDETHELARTAAQSVDAVTTRQNELQQINNAINAAADAGTITNTQMETLQNMLRDHMAATNASLASTSATIHLLAQQQEHTSQQFAALLEAVKNSRISAEAPVAGGSGRVVSASLGEVSAPAPSVDPSSYTSPTGYRYPGVAPALPAEKPAPVVYDVKEDPLPTLVVRDVLFAPSAPRITPRGQGSYIVSWQPVVFTEDSPYRGLMLRYEVLMDGDKVLYSGIETRVGIRVGSAAPTSRLSVRYSSGIYASPWSTPALINSSVKKDPSINTRIVRFLVWGAGGAGGGSEDQANDGGAGGFVTALYEAEPSEQLTIVVGAGGKVTAEASGGRPNGGSTHMSSLPTALIAGGGGGSSHIISTRHRNEVILGAGGGGGGASNHMYSGAPGIGGGGGGGTHDGRVGTGGCGAGIADMQMGENGRDGGGGGGASPRYPPGLSDVGGAGGHVGLKGGMANGAGGSPSTIGEILTEEGMGRKAGGGGGGAASCKHCIEGSFRSVDATNRLPVVISGEESNEAGRGGNGGCALGHDGRIVIVFANGSRAVFDKAGEYRVILPAEL